MITFPGHNWQRRQRSSAASTGILTMGILVAVTIVGWALWLHYALREDVKLLSRVLQLPSRLITHNYAPFHLVITKIKAVEPEVITPILTYITTWGHITSLEYDFKEE